MFRKKSYRLIKWVVLSLILSGFISGASAFDFSKLQWKEGISGKLQQGEEISYMGYTVKVVSFPPAVESDKYKEIPAEPVEPFVELNISKNGSFINVTVLVPGDSYVTYDGELKVTAKQLPSKEAKEWLYESYAPYATLELNPRGTPHLEVSIDTDHDEYVSSSSTEIVATVTLKNTGAADAFDVDMDIATELPIKRGPSNYHYEKVEKGESITKTITFSSPFVTEKKPYSIFANVSGYDVKELSYTAKLLKKISVAPEPLQMPSMRKSANSKVYLKDYTMVSLSLKNNAKYELKNVSITDSVPNRFKLIGNNSLHWVVNIPAYAEWDIRYLIKPQEPDKAAIALPAASADFVLKKEYYSVQSNRPEIMVYGPRIALNKHTDVSEIKPGDAVTVTVKAENTGSTPTKVTIKDELPKDATIVSGTTAREEYLEANKAVSFSYTFKVNSEEGIKLPPATAEYYELGTKGNKISRASEELEIKIKAPETPTAAPEVQPVVEVPDNSSTIGGAQKPSVDEPKIETVPAQPVPDPKIEEPAAVVRPFEVDTFLNLLLGCEDNNNSRFNVTQTACNYFQSGT